MQIEIKLLAASESKLKMSHKCKQNIIAIDTDS